ncbi:hypothetical protein SAMN06297144_0444 [Sphingomonas guangdongensis]|uniref:GCN5-related N-acetyltransferase n=1 Tax=Sphingomonas guangdongensis TaxID=1141890 RepID=A0A285QBG5_9SPHN|nr:GCN5-related N-acetyltransferase [Sphingomonas guangdongensis]SOB79233.1 hypothetical protein SAMN06297144_0444 [Sphingomonas guangdongensis]
MSPAPDRSALEARWLELTRAILPALAGPRGWPVRYDHCFQRILFDAATGGVWYDAISKRPAYRHASDAVLDEAVRLAEAVADGSADLPALNDRSLAWRRARKAAT